MHARGNEAPQQRTPSDAAGGAGVVEGHLCARPEPLGPHHAVRGAGVAHGLAQRDVECGRTVLI